MYRNINSHDTFNENFNSVQITLFSTVSTHISKLQAFWLHHGTCHNTCSPGFVCAFSQRIPVIHIPFPTCQTFQVFRISLFQNSAQFEQKSNNISFLQQPIKTCFSQPIQRKCQQRKNWFEFSGAHCIFCVSVPRDAAANSDPSLDFTSALSAHYAGQTNLWRLSHCLWFGLKDNCVVLYSNDFHSSQLFLWVSLFICWTFIRSPFMKHWYHNINHK